MISKLVVFCLVFLGIFALLIGTMPSGFKVSSFNATARDLAIKNEFDVNDLLAYDNQGADNMTFQYSSLFDAPSPPQWGGGMPNNQYLEVLWKYVNLGGVITVKTIMVKQIQKNYFLFFPPWYSEIERLQFYFPNASESIGAYLLPAYLNEGWSNTYNSSRFYCKGSQISVGLIVKPYNTSLTILEAWDDGHLDYSLTYSVNFTASGVGLFSIIGQLLTFQSPSLGIPDPWGATVNLFIAIPVWVMIAFLIYKFLSGLIPWVSGGSGD